MSVFGFGNEHQIKEMPDLLNPEYFVLDDQQMYIVEGATVSIYSLKDLTLKKKFGQQGEGPSEFILDSQTDRPMFIDVQGKEIIVTSFGKVSIFTKNGDFVKELKLRTASGKNFQPLGSGYVAYVIRIDGKKLMRSIMLYDRDLNPIKPIIQAEHHYQTGKGLKVFREPTSFITRKNKLYVTWHADFRVSVYDKKGILLYHLKRPYERLKVGDLSKEAVISYLKTHPKVKQFFEMVKPIKFPAKFPAIRQMRIADDKIYIVTYKEKNQRFECFIYQQDGKPLSTKTFYLEKMNALQTYPFYIKNNRLYQLVEKDERWLLHISQL
jgi:hypothetical protein